MKRNQTMTLALISYFSIAEEAYAAPGFNQGSSLPTQFNRIINAEEHGVIANDGIDDSIALQAIIDSQISINNRLCCVIQWN